MRDVLRVALLCFGTLKPFNSSEWREVNLQFLASLKVVIMEHNGRSLGFMVCVSEGRGNYYGRN